MARLDVALLHAPAIYDFREGMIEFGPVSDLVPSSAIFEIFPLGLSTIGEYLERNGYLTRTINLAFRMLRDKSFSVPDTVRALDPTIFGIDLHWMVHCHGSIEVARICKKEHPDTPVIFGGLSSTFFYEDLLGYECIDFILRGDSTEEPFRQLMEILTIEGKGYRGELLADIPNLSWKDATGAHRHNELTHVPTDFNTPALDFAYNMKSVIRYRDLIGQVPFKDFLRYPMTASIICRGCTYNCVTCGGSSTAFRKHFGRPRTAFRDPELAARDLGFQHRYLPGPLFLLNDFMQPGMDYARTFIEALGRENIDAPVGFELFDPPPPEIYELLQENLSDWSIEISAESHDDAIRKQFGKGHFTTAQLEESIRLAFEHGATRFDLFFLMGIPGQDRASAMETVEYCAGLYDRFNNDKRLLTFTSPMVPFLDPGSMVYDNPEKYGYSLRATTVEEHRELLRSAHWRDVMNYDSHLFPRDEIVEATQEALDRMNQIKIDVGVNTREEIEGNTEMEWGMEFKASTFLNCVEIGIKYETKNLFNGRTTPAVSDIHRKWREENQVV